MTGDRGLRGEYAVTAVSQEKSAGQLPHDDGSRGLVDGGPAGGPVVASAKTGYVFPNEDGRSLGSQ